MKNNTPEYFNAPFLKKDVIFFRHYQNNIINRCKNKNSLVVLPTGLGKTIVGILFIANALKKYKGSGKVVILAPTRPLVSQHKKSCEKFLDVDHEKICLLIGKIPPHKRIFIFNNSKIIISTPQVIKNDLMRSRYDLSHVSLIIFDEAHRTTGNYSYNFISNEYINTCSDPLILGLTASPGKNFDRIQHLCDNLFIEEVVFKSREDDDVKLYIQDIDTFTEKIDLPIKYLEIGEIWNSLFTKFLKFFIQRGLINPYQKYYSKLDFLRICHDLSLSLRHDLDHDSNLSNEEIIEHLFFQSPKIIDIIKEKNINIQSIFSFCSSCISILHAKDLLETQEITLFKSFLDKIYYKSEHDVISAKRIVQSKHFKYINSLLKRISFSDFSHPKINKLISIIKDEMMTFQNKKLIIFTQYREMAEFLKNRLVIEFSESENLKIEKFIGQSTKIEDFGYSQSEQIKILEQFRNDAINILIATSVAEEGLDIPNVDAIIFYEPVPSEIRLIQRRGRTGRFSNGRCYILLAMGTVDIPFYLVSCKKEKEMNEILTKPNQLKLIQDLKREKINFSLLTDCHSNLKLVKNFNERRKYEEEILANRIIEDIIVKIDEFSNSSEFKHLKNIGVSLFSDIIKNDPRKMRNNILKIKNIKKKHPKKQKQYLNKNVKTLINIAKYNKNGKIKFSKFQLFAKEEEITDKKFFIHFNQACNLGFLKKDDNYVVLIKDFN